MPSIAFFGNQVTFYSMPHVS